MRKRRFLPFARTRGILESAHGTARLRPDRPDHRCGHFFLTQKQAVQTGGKTSRRLFRARNVFIGKQSEGKRRDRPVKGANRGAKHRFADRNEEIKGQKDKQRTNYAEPRHTEGRKSSAGRNRSHADKGKLRRGTFTFKKKRKSGAKRGRSALHTTRVEPIAITRRNDAPSTKFRGSPPRCKHSARPAQAQENHCRDAAERRQKTSGDEDILRRVS